MSKAHDRIELLDWERRMSRHVEPGITDDDGDAWLIEAAEDDDTEERILRADRADMESDRSEAPEFRRYVHIGYEEDE